MGEKNNKFKYIAAMVVFAIISVIGIGQIIFCISVASGDSISLNEEASILNRYSLTIKEDISDKNKSESYLNSISNINDGALVFINNNAINKNVDEELSNGLDNIAQKLSNYKALNDVEKESILNQVQVLKEKVENEKTKSDLSPKLGIILLVIGTVGMAGTIFTLNKFGI